MKAETSNAHDQINIRPMQETDIEIIAVHHCPPWSTVDTTKERWNKYHREQQEGSRTVGVVEQEQKILGYGSLFLKNEMTFTLLSQGFM
ncbi:MAG TPA: hypothetical protein VIH61_05165 [Waddliaceae bacterium]